MSRLGAACVLVGLLLGDAAAGGEPLCARHHRARLAARRSSAPYSTWAQQLSSAFTEHLGFPADHVIVLSGTSNDEAQQSTQQNVRAAIARLRREVQKDDLLVILLVGHGTVDDGQAKFNLVGPDLTSEEWGALLRRPARPGRRGQHLRAAVSRFFATSPAAAASS